MSRAVGLGLGPCNAPPAPPITSPPRPPSIAASRACFCPASDWNAGMLFCSVPFPYSSRPVWKYSVAASAGAIATEPSAARAARPPSPSAYCAPLSTRDLPSITFRLSLSPTNSSPPAATDDQKARPSSDPVSVRPSSCAFCVRSPKISPASWPNALAPITALRPIVPAAAFTASFCNSGNNASSAALAAIASFVAVSPSSFAAVAAAIWPASRRTIPFATVCATFPRAALPAIVPTPAPSSICSPWPPVYPIPWAIHLASAPRSPFSVACSHE